MTDFKTISRGASYVFDCGKNLGTHGAPHGAPMEPLQGATFEKSPPAPLLIVTDFKTIFLEVPVTFLNVVKICESQGPTHGAPMEPPPHPGGYL